MGYLPGLGSWLRIARQDSWLEAKMTDSPAFEGSRSFCNRANARHCKHALFPMVIFTQGPFSFV